MLREAGPEHAEVEGQENSPDQAVLLGREQNRQTEEETSNHRGEMGHCDVCQILIHRVLPCDQLPDKPGQREPHHPVPLRGETQSNPESEEGGDG